jgi:hypothetical protein
MSNNKESQSKVTYSTKEQRWALLLQEAFRKDLKLFQTLLDNTRDDWTLTVITKDGERSLVVNIPAKKK